jgi:hypothetical protein
LANLSTKPQHRSFSVKKQLLYKNENTAILLKAQRSKYFFGDSVFPIRFDFFGEAGDTH